MPVRGHGDQVAVLVFGQGQDAVGRLSALQCGVDLKTLGGQFGHQPVEIRPVVAHFFRLVEAEPLLVAGDEAVGHVDQRQVRAGEPGQAADVLQNGSVDGRIVEGDQDVRVHGVARSIG